jgi:hypothetical protein
MGSISRADVAAVCVEALTNTAAKVSPGYSGLLLYYTVVRYGRALRALLLLLGSYLGPTTSPKTVSIFLVAQNMCVPSIIGYRVYVHVHLH